MFQSFKSKAAGGDSAHNLAGVREQMAAEKLDAWLVPHGDEHQNEYPPAHAARLGWLTGFTGSAGFCVVTCEHAIVFVDGRYTLQAADQIDAAHFKSDSLTDNPPAKWLAQWLKEDEVLANRDAPIRIGYDPYLQTIAAHRNYEKHLKPFNIEWVPLDNLADRVWQDQPNPPLEPVSIHELEFAGELALDKIERIREKLVQNEVDHCLLSDPASTAWLLNIRGGDTPHTPLAIGYTIVSTEGLPQLFMDKRKMSQEVEAYLTQLCDLHPPSSIEEVLAQLADNTTIQMDRAHDSIALYEIAKEAGAKITNKSDPIAIERAVKNQAEIAGTRTAHLRDGVAICKFLHWLDQQPAGSLDEIEAVKKLENTRAQTAKSLPDPLTSELLEISFETISGAGANGAIVHYRVTEETNAKLEDGSLYLVDSGAQYRDGTTDITRTVAIGTPPEMAVEDFTLVLKGHIAVGSARFPKGTRGVDLDPLARIALWQQGRDYAHGTGHGVGSYLSVHEGPQSISKRGMAELKPGMIISNEPGYYREGQYGIRIENLVVVDEPKPSDDGNIETMGFETLTLAPIDLRLVRAEQLTDNELRWLNAYHGWVKRKITPFLDEGEALWLAHATRPISRELPAASA